MSGHEWWTLPGPYPSGEGPADYTTCNWCDAELAEDDKIECPGPPAWMSEPIVMPRKS